MTLLPYQVPHEARMLRAFNELGYAVDGSDPGTGKTYVGSSIATKLNMPVLVACPKVSVPVWRRVLQGFGVEVIDVVNFEKLRTGNTPYGSWTTKKKQFMWNLPQNTLLIFDEAHRCLPKETRVATPHGYTEIQNLKVGDMVETPLGPRPVTGVWETPSKPVCRITHSKGELVGSADHPVYVVGKGFKTIDAIEIHDMLCIYDIKEVSPVPSAILREEKASSVLREIVQNQVPALSTGGEKSPIRANDAAPFEPQFSADEGHKGSNDSQQPLEDTRDQRENIRSQTGKTIPKQERRKWIRVDPSSANAVLIPPRLYTRVHRVGLREEQSKVGSSRGLAPDAGGLGRPKNPNSYRVGRRISQHAESQNKGQEERRSADEPWLDSSSLQKRGGAFELPPNCTPSEVLSVRKEPNFEPLLGSPSTSNHSR